MKKLLVFGIIAATLLTACGGGDEKEAGSEITKAKGQIKDLDGRLVDIYYGGVFKINEVEEFTTLYPHGVAEVVAHRIANQAYQGLVRLDQETLDVIPCIAESWDVDSTATVFTYHLREGIRFHDDQCFEGGEGREVTAKDFEWCFKQLCTPAPKNLLSGLVVDRIKGAREYFDAAEAGNTPENLEGVKVIDDYTLQITLRKPFASWNKVMATPAGWVFPKEAVERYDKEMRVHMVGTGPFKYKNYQDAYILVRNDDYWETDKHGNKLPYLRGVKFTFFKEKKQELNAFKKGDLDMVWKLPVDQINNILVDFNEVGSQQVEQDYKFQSENGMTIQYYAFLLENSPFTDKKVRQAFNYAIDREKLVDFTLQGEGDPAEYGVVPPMNGYPYESINGFTFDADKARQLMAEAGYPNGNGFPEVTLQLNSGGSTNELLAEAIQHQLKENIGVTVKFDLLPMTQHRMRFETGQSEFWRAAWVADYPDPENFLNLWYGKHVPASLNERAYFNASRYKNPEFDSLFVKALRTVDEEERMALYAKCDQILIDDAVIMPIYYDNYMRLLQLDVANFPINPMEYRDLTRVFFKKIEKKDREPAN